MKIKNYINRFIVLILFGFIFVSCSEDPTPVLYDEFKDKGQDTPEVTSINPPDSAWAAIDTITITGKNFSADSADNWVYFNNVPGTVLTASTTELKVKVPDYPKDSIVLKIVRRTAERYAEVKYKLREAIGYYRVFKTGEVPKAITFDKDGVMYVSMVINGIGVGIKKIVDGNLVDYAPKGSETNWNSIKFGGTQLYAAKGNLGVWVINPGVAPTNAPWVQTADNISDFDFSQAGMIYAAGSKNLYRINPTNKNQKKFTTSINAKAVRVYNGYVYLAGTLNNKEGVWRFQIIDADNLGPEELYYDFSGNFPNIKIRTMTIDNVGKVILGTEGNDPIYSITTAKVGSVLYAGSLKTKAGWFAWANGTPYMCYTKDLSGAQTDLLTTVFKVYIGSGTAPYYGLQL